MALFLHNAPVTEFLRWFNENYETPPIVVKFTALDLQCSYYEAATWTIWIDVRQTYQDIVDILGQEASRCVAAFQHRDPDVVYEEIKRRWVDHIESSALSRQQVIRRKLT